MAVAAILGLTGTSVPAFAAAAPPKPTTGPARPAERAVPVTPVVSHYRAPKPTASAVAAPVTWPTGTGVAVLRTGAAGPGGGDRAAVEATGLPVWVGAVPGAAGSATPAAVRVQAATRTAAEAAGVSGVLLAARRSDGSTAAARVRITLDYHGYRGAFGGDWASRLRLVALPACALGTPSQPACRAETALPFHNDQRAGTLQADITLPAGRAGPADPVVLAAAATPSGSGGDFTATSLRPAGSWQVGTATGAFNWSYPVPVPAVPGDLSPSVQLSYNSQAQDGLTSSTNTQASFVGDGWDYNPGFIERSYQSCHENPAGPTKTFDTCWSADNTLTLSLGGESNTLVPDDHTANLYHPQNDDGEKVERLPDLSAANGAQDGEHWKVTTDDGTQYFFGLDKLPGWQNGKDETQSVDTEPVFSTASRQPCFNTTFSLSVCPNMGYRWNLDYVVDTHSDVISYFYTTEKGVYAKLGGTNANASYTRASFLRRIQYGQRAGAVYTTQPAAQVLFDVKGRCDTSTTGCELATLTKANAAHWPDVPFDLNCVDGAACDVVAPTFWSDVELTGIRTEALSGTTETPVDSIALTHKFPPSGDTTRPELWLDTITRTGRDTGAGGTGVLALPPITFTGQPLPNRMHYTDGNLPITRQRLITIVTETGAQIAVNYSAAPAPTTAAPDPATNGTLTYPAYWARPGQANPAIDWFNKYRVTSVVQNDPTGGSGDDSIDTIYTPVGVPAWHHDDNPLTPAARRTWNQWRGFAGMTVTTGHGNVRPTKVTYSYFRGMDGDTMPAGTPPRQVTLTDSRGDPAVDDASQYSGRTYETRVYDGATVIGDTVQTPWSSGPTATHPLPGLPAVVARHLGTAATKTYQTVASGGTRSTQIAYTNDDTRGRIVSIDDLGDTSTPTDDLCTTNTYNDNPDKWIFTAVARVTKVAVACGTAPQLPDSAVSDVRTFFDNATDIATPPTAGDPTRTQLATSYASGAALYTDMSTQLLDQYGRVTSSTDALGRPTGTAYTPATGAQPTTVAVTDPAQLLTTTAYDPLRGLPTKVTDPAKYVTTEQYDALGRLTAVWKPGLSTAGPASLKYAYTVSAAAPSSVVAATLNEDGTSYRRVETLYDSLLRPREVQTELPDGTRTVADTNYNTTGKVARSTDPYFVSSPLSSTLVQAQDGDVDSITGYDYDGAGRTVATVSYDKAVETWRTTTRFDGNVVTVTPPAGATATSNFLDARGQLTDLWQYHAGVTPDPVHAAPADYDHISYGYTPAGDRASLTDPAGNVWTWRYDLLGQQTQAHDPDGGDTATRYDVAGQLITSTDARGKQVTHAYDPDGRETGTFDTTGGQPPAAANQLTKRTYDTVKKGLPGTATSFSGGDTYSTSVLIYNAFGSPSSVTTTLTGPDAALVPPGGYNTGYGVSGVGTPTDTNYPAGGGLQAEDVTVGRDNFAQASSLSSPLWTPVSAVGYTHLGEPTHYTLPTTTAANLGLDLTYDPQTHNLTDSTLGLAGGGILAERTYHYGSAGVSKGSGLLTSTVDRQGAGVVDTQCYDYDYATRLRQAWTATDGCAATPAAGSSSTVGGAVAPYWQSWTYDPAGDRLSQTDHGLGGAGDTVTAYAYPAAGATATRPHGLTGTTSTGPAAAAHTAAYGYDAAGRTTSISGGATGAQTLSYDANGKTATDDTAAGRTSYVYDADGNVVLRRDPASTTFFFGDEQLVLDKATGAVSGTRYYSINGSTIAEFSSNHPTVQYLVPDLQGTTQVLVDSAGAAVTRRAYLPFGAARGATPAAWPGDRGYTTGTFDPATSLLNLGAREYDPNSGRFLAPDPVLDPNDPQSLNGYDLADNNPTTRSDPTGLRPMIPCADGPEGPCSPPGAKKQRPRIPKGVSKGAERAPVPKVKDAGLQRKLDKDIYGGASTKNNDDVIGRGKVGDALIHEKQTGEKTRGVFHAQDVADLVGYLRNRLAGTGKGGPLGAGDRVVAIRELNELLIALKYPDENGAVTRRINELPPKVRATIAAVTSGSLVPEEQPQAPAAGSGGAGAEHGSGGSKPVTGGEGDEPAGGSAPRGVPEAGGGGLHGEPGAGGLIFLFPDLYFVARYGTQGYGCMLGVFGGAYCQPRTDIYG